LGQALNYGFVTLPRDIGASLGVGLLVAGIISTVFQPGSIERLAGSGILPMLAMMVIGIPLYVCATASVPIAAALIIAGVSPGAALVFLVAGPATNAATISTIWKILGRNSALVYLSVVAVGALLSGLVLNAIFAMPAVSPPGHVHELLPPWLSQASAVLLLCVLAWSLLPRRPVQVSSPEQDEETVVLNVKGMNCSHCVESVEKALTSQQGVTSVAVDLRASKAVVVGRHLEMEHLTSSVESIGFTASPVD
jgi:copper chaperone CopZ